MSTNYEILIKFQILIILLFVNVFCYSEHDLTCTKLSSCSCKLSNGGIVDLSPLSHKQVQTASDSSLYNLFLCYSRNYGTSGTTCTNSKDVAICQEVSVSEDVNIYYNLGTQYSAQFSVSNPYPLQIDIFYSGGDSKRNTTLNVRCDKSIESELSFLGSYNGHTEFALHTKYGCPDVIEIGGSAPVLFILLVLAGVVLGIYMLIGMGVNYKLKGARGFETIPHLNFWKESPFLFFDGFYFISSPCLQCARDNLAKRSASYAQI